jgi:hypothetical protein
MGFELLFVTLLTCTLDCRNLIPARIHDKYGRFIMTNWLVLWITHCELFGWEWLVWYDDLACAMRAFFIYNYGKVHERKENYDAGGLRTPRAPSVIHVAHPARPDGHIATGQTTRGRSVPVPPLVRLKRPGIK